MKWRRRKLWEYLKVRWKETRKKVELWRGSFQTLEGRFGPATTTFFIFIKWLMLLNVITAILIVVFVVVPSALLDERDEICLPNNTTTTSIPCCSQLYINNSSFVIPSVFEILEGTGWLERTLLFYGAYPYNIQDELITYNLPVAYMTTFVIIFIICFYAILQAGSSGFKERLVEGEGQYYKFCSLIFSGWDFCLYSDKGASAKHKALFMEIKEWIEEERREDDKKTRMKEECCRTWLVRIFICVLTLLIFLACTSLVYFTIQFSQSELQNENHPEDYQLLLEYAPSLCVVGLHLIVPNILTYLVSLEGFSPVNTMRMVLFTHLALRFSTVFVLLVSIKTIIECGVGTHDTCVSRACHTPLCWETFLAQQLYKLILLDTFMQIIITFLVNFPRMLLSRQIRCKLAKIIGSQEFDLLKHLVDVAYIQFLVWLGSYFMPLLPIIATIHLFFMFYMKKFACLVNSMPTTTTVYRVTRSKSLYLLVILGVFCAAMGPLSYTIIMIQPSRSCGPFRGLTSGWSLVVITYATFPSWFKRTVTLATSSAVAFPSLIFLLLLFYYYYTLTRENRQMVVVLKKQLVLEGHDKQFLLNRLSAFIKQHQERHKPARSIDPPPANSA